MLLFCCSCDSIASYVLDIWMEEIRVDRYKNMLLNVRLEITEPHYKVENFCA